MKNILIIIALLINIIYAKEIIDHNNEKINLNGVPKKIIIQGILPLPSVFTVFNGGNNELIGIPIASTRAAKGTLLEKFFPNITRISNEFDGGKDINIEAVLKANPDAVFMHASAKPIKERLDLVNVPAIGFSTNKFDYNSIDTFDGWLSLLGEIMEKEDKAKGIVAHAKEVQKDINSKLRAVKKQNALIIFRYKNGQITVVGQKHFAKFWLENAGLTNAYNENKGTTQISLEDLYHMDPDIIYITNFTELMPEDLNSQVDNLDFSKLKAVRNKRVYKYPLGMYRYYPPASEVPLVLKWMAKTAHPEIFKDMDLNKEMKEFYKNFYDVKISDEDVKSILNPPRSAGDV